MPDLKTTIYEQLIAFKTKGLRPAALDLLNSLGYASDKTIELDGSPEAFLEQFNQNPESTRFNEEKALSKDWKEIQLLFQLTDQELGGQADLFKDNAIKQSLMTSYLFFAVKLSGKDYARGKLASITRQLNRLFPMPVMVFFEYDAKISIAVINRRRSKRDAEKDVLGKVTLIQAIDLTKPHRGHLDIISSFALPELAGKTGVQSFDALHAAWEEIFNVELLNNKFYREISNWYFWAMQKVEFPDGLEKKEDVRNATSLIRLLTRVIFCWFLREKGLIPDSLFKEEEARRLLKDMSPGNSTFYKAILQNLFFATLNQKMNRDKNSTDRRFISDQRFQGKSDDHGVKNIYRHSDLFALPEEDALQLFAVIPFLNGGLFECLDPTDEETGKVHYADGFSETSQNQPVVPNELFFGAEDGVNLSKELGNKFKSVSVRGLFAILENYKFTVVENTPVEQEIALDPELLGKVFENLLASYDEDTKKTARKQSGSFYTPRPIADNMVDNALKAYLNKQLCSALPHITEQTAQYGLDVLFAYREKENVFVAEEEIDALIKAIDNCKILDPACGSGAFPMGVLHKLVYILHKLDPENRRWEARQIERAEESIEEVMARENAIEAIRKTFRDYADNNDYGRKLYLIENCIYGSDIQPIAIQISKLRFFISLICDQKTSNSKKENCGVRPLPNLETKFVVANSLLKLNQPGQMDLENPAVRTLERKVEKIRHEHFAVQSRRKKMALQREDKELRKKLAYELSMSFMSADSSRKIQEWNPYDPTCVADFFSPEWMFGRRCADGFDIVIGNPPYGGTKISDELKNELQLGSKDIYGAFISRALGQPGEKDVMLKHGGILSFIVSDTFMTIKTHKPLRAQIMRNRIDKMIRVHPDTFKATVNTAIILLERDGSDEPISEENQVLMADLTRINIHDQYDRFLQLLERTTEEHEGDQEEPAHRMSGPDWRSESTEEYAFYHYPQRLIRTNSNLPFFVASPKLFALMQDVGNQYVINEDGLPSFGFQVSINGRELHLFKLGDKYTGAGRTRHWLNEGLFQILSGIKTGNNAPYLRILSEEAQKSFDLISEVEVLSDRDAEKLSEEEKLNGIKQGRHYVRFEMGMPSNADDGMLPCYFQSPSLIAIDWSEEGVAGMRGEARSDLANASYRFADLNRQISFSGTGQYAPTFRMANAPVFLNMASRIFLREGNCRESWIGLLNSKIFRYTIKQFLNHGVHVEVEDLKSISVPNIDDELKSFVFHIVSKQEMAPDYDYASNEQMEIDRLVYEAHGLNADDIQEVENWYARRYPKLAAAQRRNREAKV